MTSNGLRRRLNSTPRSEVHVTVVDYVGARIGRYHGHEPVVPDQHCEALEQYRKQALVGRTLEDISTGRLLDTREFEFPRFRFDYMLQKTNPKQEPKKQIFIIISIDYLVFRADGNILMSLSGRMKRDSNPRSFRLVVFQATALGRSAILPRTPLTRTQMQEVTPRAY